MGDFIYFLLHLGPFTSVQKVHTPVKLGAGVLVVHFLVLIQTFWIKYEELWFKYSLKNPAFKSVTADAKYVLIWGSLVPCSVLQSGKSHVRKGVPERRPEDWFPVVDMHRLGGLQRCVYSFMVLGPEVWNHGADKVMFLPEALWGDSLPCLFQLLVAASISWLVATSFQFLPPPSQGFFLSVGLLFLVSKF